MTVQEYEELQENGFSVQQINQISILETNYFELEAILKYVTQETDAENIRKLNEIFKKFGCDIIEYDVEFMMMMLKYNLNPKLYYDEIYDDYVKEALQNTILKMRNADELLKEKCTQLIGKIKELVCENEEENELLSHITNNILPEIATIDLNKIFLPTFNVEQVRYAASLYRHHFEHLIPEIAKINNPDNFMYNGDALKKIVKHGMDFASICNSYDTNNTNYMLRAYEDYGIDVNPFLLNKPYSNNVLLCQKLLNMDREGLLGSDTIEKCLELGWEYDSKEEGAWTKIAVLESTGFDLKKYFDEFPGKFGIMLFETLVEAGYVDSEIQRFIKLFSKDRNLNTIKQLESEDILSIINLYENDYDISVLIANEIQKKTIDILLDISIKCDLDFESLLCRDYKDYELLIIENCIENNRFDVIPALIAVRYPSNGAYELLMDIMDHDTATGEHHNIINLLFDKGNDVFNGFDECYEFSVEQKYMLAWAMVRDGIDDKNIDMIRDTKIEDTKMRTLVWIIEKGHDVSEIVKKIDTLEEDDIMTLGKCLELGFNLSADEKDLNRS